MCPKISEDVERLSESQSVKDFIQKNRLQAAVGKNWRYLLNKAEVQAKSEIAQVI